MATHDSKITTQEALPWTRNNVSPLKEKIASGIAHGLSNTEIYGTLGKKDECIYPADLIDVIRDLMTEQKDDLKEEFLAGLLD